MLPRTHLTQLTTKVIKKKLVKETIWSILSKGLPFPFFFGINIVLARYLSLEGYGTWSFFYSFLTIVTLLFHFGINAATKNNVARYRESEELGMVLKTSLVLRILLSSIFVLAAVLFRQQILNVIQHQELTTLFLVSLPFIFLTNIVEYLKEVFQGLHRLKYNLIINLSEYGLKLVFLVLALSISASLLSVVLSFTAALVVTIVIGGSCLYFLFYKKTAPNRTRSFYTELIKNSLPLFFVSIGFAIATELDTIMVGMLKGPAEAGVFSAAKQIVNKLPHIAVALSIGSMPIFAHITKENKQKLRRTFSNLLVLNTGVFTVVITGLITTGWWWLPRLYGAEYSASYLPLVLLMPYLLFYSYSTFLSAFLDYQGKAGRRAVNFLVCIVVNIGLNMYLIPRYGAAGTALASSIAYTPYFLLNWLEVRKTWNRYN